MSSHIEYKVELRFSLSGDDAERREKARQVRDHVKQIALLFEGADVNLELSEKKPGQLQWWSGNELMKE